MKKQIERLLSLIIVLAIAINIISIHVFADSAPYTLQQNTVQDENGQWVTSGGAYTDSRWGMYNCYGYAINRFELSGFYLEANDRGDIQYKVGEIESEMPIELEGIDYNQLLKVVERVKEELRCMGYTGVSHTLNTIPDVSPSEQLICVRMGTNGTSFDYHFMRYDLETDAWYHKPSTSAILKFNGVPSRNVEWIEEGCYSDKKVEKGENRYTGDIVFIKYTKNTIALPQSAPDVKHIKEGRDVLIEFKVNVAGNYNISISSRYAFNYEIYDNDFNIINSNIGKTSVSIVPNLQKAGTYYIRANFYSENVEGDVSIGIEHQHTYPPRAIYFNSSLHKKTCPCGGSVEYEGHYVRRSEIVDGRYANCIGCLRRLDLTTDNAGIIMNTVIKISDNGSYVLSNGVVVLVDEDVEAFLNGTLEFNTYNEPAEIS